MLLRIALTAVLVNVLYLASVLLAARLFGVKVERLSLGFGPKLLDRPMGSVQVELHAAPLSSWVALEGMADDEGPVRGFRALHPLARFALLLGGWALPLLLAMGLLGPLDALRSVGATCGQMAAGLDVREAARLWRTFAALPPVSAVGVLTAKMVAFNLLPLPPLTGAQALATLLTWKRPRPLVSPGVYAAVSLLWMLLSLGALVQWGRGLYLALSGS